MKSFQKFMLTEMANVVVKRYTIVRDESDEKLIFLYGRSPNFPSYIIAFQGDKVKAYNMQPEKIKKAHLAHHLERIGTPHRTKNPKVQDISPATYDIFHAMLKGGVKEEHEHLLFDAFFYRGLDSELSKFASKENKVTDTLSLVKWVKTRTKLNDNDLSNVFKIDMKDIADQFEEEFVSIYGGAKALYPLGMQKAHITAFEDAWTRAATTLIGHGLKDVVAATEVRFTDIPGRVGGLYMIKEKHLIIDRGGLKDKKKITDTIIHELGHKHMFEFLPSSAVSDLAKFYNTKIRTLDSDAARLEAIANDVTDIVRVGDPVKYNGKKKSFLKFGTDYKVNRITPQGIKLESKSVPGVTLGPEKVEAFMGSDFEFKDTDKIEKRLSIKLQYSSSDAKMKVEGIWPSKYGKKSSDEYYAEMFVLYCTDRAGRTIHKIMESMIKKKKFPSDIT